MSTPAENTTASTFVLIHGAADVGWSWHLVADELRAHGHDVIAPDLPCEDDAAGLPEFADAVEEAVVAALGAPTGGTAAGGTTTGGTRPAPAAISSWWATPSEASRRRCSRTACRSPSSST